MAPRPKVSLQHKRGVESPGLNKFRNNYNWVSACIRGERSVFLNRPVCEDSSGIFADLPLSACYGENQEIVDRLHLWTGLSIDEERDWDWKPAQGPEQLLKRNPEMPTEVQSRSLENRFRGFRLHWKKVIGKGGFGLITLWEVEFEDGHREDVVFKMPKEPSENIYRELRWHDRYRMASVILQARDLAEEAEDHKLNGRFARGEVFDPRKENILVLEYMNRGSLHSVLQNVAIKNRMFPSTALWQLWQFCKYLCPLSPPSLMFANCHLPLIVVIGVAEVAYQPVLRRRFGQSLVDGLAKNMFAGPEQLERFFAHLEELPISHDVHFDLEETNSRFNFSGPQPSAVKVLTREIAVLVTQDEETNIKFKVSILDSRSIIHVMLICVQLHDFGPSWSKQMREKWETWPQEHYWAMRGPVKPRKHLPVGFFNTFSRSELAPR